MNGLFNKKTLAVTASVLVTQGVANMVNHQKFTWGMFLAPTLAAVASSLSALFVTPPPTDKK